MQLHWRIGDFPRGQLIVRLCGYGREHPLITRRVMIKSTDRHAWGRNRKAGTEDDASMPAKSKFYSNRRLDYWPAGDRGWKPSPIRLSIRSIVALS